MFEKSKNQIIEYCKDSVFDRETTVPSEPDDFCKRVGRILRKFRFVKDELKQRDQKSTFFGVGLIAYCGACECCARRKLPSKQERPADVELSKQKQDEFLSAAKRGDISLLRSFYKVFPMIIESRDTYDNTALTLAAFFADKNTVQFLVEELGMDETKTGTAGMNCFLLAAKGGKIDTMIYLDSLAPDLKNGRDNRGENALILAASFSNKATVAFLLDEFNFSVDSKGLDGLNCYLNALIWGNIDTFEYLHRNFPKLRNSRDNDGQSALDLAEQRKQVKFIDFLGR